MIAMQGHVLQKPKTHALLRFGADEIVSALSLNRFSENPDGREVFGFQQRRQVVSAGIKHKIEQGLIVCAQRLSDGRTQGACHRGLLERNGYPSSVRKPGNQLQLEIA
jgi:hypothetical protein